MEPRVRDRGQAVMLVLALIAVVAVLVTGVGALGVRIVARQQAAVAADAAALAGVVGGEPAARSVAAANGAVLVSFVRTSYEVTVTVAHRGEQATARASRAP